SESISLTCGVTQGSVLILTQGHTIFNRVCYTMDENEKYLSQSGLIAHDNCTISSPFHAHTKFSKTNPQLQLLLPIEEIKCNTISKKKASANDCLKQLKLPDLPIGFYDVKEIAPRISTYGKFLIRIDYQGSVVTIISNKILDDCIPVSGIKATIDNSTVAQLHIIQKKRDRNR